MNPSNVYEGIRRWLLGKHIEVPDGWIPECVSFLESEGITGGKLYDAVYEQWLMGDLTSLELPVFSKAINNDGYYQGVFALQVNFSVDISKSMFSQLRALVGANDGNLDVQEFEDPTNKWEPKASRCLMLEITDGVRKLKALELEQIKDLSQALSPGCKIMLRGPLRCVNNCLLLSEGCITVLGGQVDELTERHNQKSVLEEFMQNIRLIRRVDDCKKTFPNPGKLTNAKPDVNSYPMISGKQNTVKTIQSSRPIKYDQSSSYDNESKTKIEPKPYLPSKRQENGVWDDLSDSEFLQPKEEVINEPFLTDDIKNRKRVGSEMDVQRSNSKKQNQMSFNASDDELLWSDEEMFPEMEQSHAAIKENPRKSPVTLRKPPVSLRKSPVTQPKSCTPESRASSTSRLNNYNPSSNNLQKKPNINEFFSDDEDMMSFEDKSEEIPLTKNMESEKESDFVDLISSDEEDFGMTTPKARPVSTVSSLRSNQPVGAATSYSVKPTARSEANVQSHSVLPQQRTQQHQPGAIPASTSQQGGLRSVTSCSDFHREQFGYLNETDRCRTGKLLVKAHISTVLAKIGLSADKASWTLPVRINDGTGYLDCHISHQIIESHIGPVKETIRKSKQSIVEKKIVIQKMKMFATWLSEVNGMIEIQFKASGAEITNIRPPDDRDIQLFKQCLARR